MTSALQALKTALKKEIAQLGKSVEEKDGAPMAEKELSKANARNCPRQPTT